MLWLGWSEMWERCVEDALLYHEQKGVWAGRFMPHNPTNDPDVGFRSALTHQIR